MAACYVQFGTSKVGGYCDTSGLLGAYVRLGLPLVCL